MFQPGTHVRVYWEDATTHPPGWITDEEAVEWAESAKCLAETEGRVVKHTEKYLLVSSHTLDGMSAEPTRIPTCCIHQVVKMVPEDDARPDR